MGPAVTAQKQSSKAKEIKTIEQIREEAKRSVQSSAMSQSQRNGAASASAQLPADIKQMNQDIEDKNQKKAQKFEPILEDVEMQYEKDKKLGFEPIIEPEDLEFDHDEDPATTKNVQAYINKQMDKKMNKLQEDVYGMIDNFQLEVLRQFQIQQGSIENLIQ